MVGWVFCAPLTLRANYPGGWPIHHCSTLTHLCVWIAVPAISDHHCMAMHAAAWRWAGPQQAACTLHAGIPTPAMLRSLRHTDLPLPTCAAHNPIDEGRATLEHRRPAAQAAAKATPESRKPPCRYTGNKQSKQKRGLRVPTQYMTHEDQPGCHAKPYTDPAASVALPGLECGRCMSSSMCWWWWWWGGAHGSCASSPSSPSPRLAAWRRTESSQAAHM